MKAHRKYLDMINLKVDGRLPGDKSAHLEKHLAACVACRREYETLASMRRRLLSTVDIPIDRSRSERISRNIMSTVRERASGKLTPRQKRVLRPVIVLATLVVIMLVSITLFHQPAPSGPKLFSDLSEAPLDRLLVHTLDEHELAGSLELFNSPMVFPLEMDTNNQLAEDQLK